MRSNVEWRRHGCGQIIGLRESCPACASAERARLHAEGKCKLEALEQTRRQAMFGVQQSTRPNELHGTMLTEHNIRDAMRHVCGDKLADALRPPAKLEPPPVGAEVSWEVAECHMRRDEKARYSAKRSYRSEYAIREGRLVLCDAKDGDWWPVSAVPSGEWVRLA